MGTTVVKFPFPSGQARIAPHTLVYVDSSVLMDAFFWHEYDNIQPGLRPDIADTAAGLHDRYDPPGCSACTGRTDDGDPLRPPLSISARPRGVVSSVSLSDTSATRSPSIFPRVRPLERPLS